MSIKIFALLFYNVHNPMALRGATMIIPILKPISFVKKAVHSALSHVFSKPQKEEPLVRNWAIIVCLFTKNIFLLCYDQLKIENV
jgi:hypothetical protein